VYSIDLHDVRHSDVRGQLDAFLYSHMNLGTSEVIIITGKSDEMKDIVRHVLVDYNMTADECFNNYGSLLVKLS
jgi:DNA-nicking Smr family endonuclease